MHINLHLWKEIRNSQPVSEDRAVQAREALTLSSSPKLGLQCTHKSETVYSSGFKRKFYPSLTLPDALGSHCVGRAMSDLFAQRLPLGEACGVRELDSYFPPFIGGIKGGQKDLCVHLSLGERFRVRAFDLCRKSILQAASKGILLIPDPDLHLILSRQIGDDDAHATAFFQRIIAFTGHDTIDNIRNEKLLNDTQVRDFINKQ
ncbi:hypothetical protein [Nostoc sp. NMS9]|uniref:hypothetical protein n=1 Tax=Nostoc sp. NMS9 TaxID=2815393 RepID=UPI0025CC1A2B|nr:hypothetical protein [Nostoc sp. NMS9]MBN3944371.1 hypothetical protein [Nostoc sp. NMS9]